MSKGPRAITSAGSLAVAERGAQILELRRQGYTLQQIGDIVGVHKTTARTAIKKYILQVTEASANELVAWEIEKLNLLERDAWGQAFNFRPALDDKGRPIFDVMYDTDGNPILNPAGQPLTVPRRDYEASNQGKALILKIHEARCKLLGLQAPKQLELCDTTPTSDDDTDKPLTFVVVRAVAGRMAETPQDLNTAAAQGATVAPTNTIEGG